MAYVVYVVACRDGKYYVGRCAANRVRQRLEEHRSSLATAFTSLYPGLHIVSSRASSDPLDEDRTVLEFMRIHGIDNVRGGSFSNVHLTRAQRDVLEMQLNHASSRCLRCGSHGHWVAQCPRAVREVEYYDADIDEDVTVTYGTYTDGDVCFRCGRRGHWVAQCYARTHVNGHVLR